MVLNSENQALPPRVREYLAFADSHPDYFAKNDGKSTLCLDPKEIKDIEKTVASRYRQRGFDPDWAEVGCYYEDPYCFLFRDAVRFGSGRVVIHHRVLWKNGPVSGVVMLPRYKNRYVLVRHYRHPVSDWSWECPRGATSPGEGVEETVAIELLEEIGSEVIQCQRIGKMFPINSFIDSGVELFLVDIDRIGTLADSEGIEDVQVLDSSELKAMIVRGEIDDASTICAVAQAEFRELL